MICISWGNCQTLLWGGPNDPNSTFSGGIGTWTTTGLSSLDPTKSANSIWTYTNNGGSKGAYSDLAGTISSPSRSNGAMIFDSDFLDNGGVAGNEGKGSSPSTHSGVLTSPLIDCSTFPTVTVSFYQYYQNYISKCTLEVSNDSGATWTSYDVNENVKPGTGTARNSRKIIDITNTAANHKNVYFRFNFAGDYYFWIIDDVTLLSLPENDLAITKHSYLPFTYGMPKSQLCGETWKFHSQISNLGADPQSGVLYKAEIIAADRATRVYRDSMYLTSNLMPSDDNVDINLPNTFDVNTLPIGKYYLRTTLSYNNTDYNPADNTRLDSFEITSAVFSREPRPRIGIRANGGTPFTVCSQFKTADCWNQNDRFFASSVEVGMSSGPKSANEDYSVKVYVAEIKDEVLPDFSNFDITHGINSPSISLLSDQELKQKIGGTFALYKLNLLNTMTNDKLFLSKNKRYFIMCSHPAEANPDDIDTWRFQVASNEKNYEGHPFAVPVIDNDGNWFNSWPDGDAPVLRLTLDVVTKNDDVALPESSLIVRPNPIQNNNLSIQISFEKETNANITIFDIHGRVQSFIPYKNLTINQLDIPVDQLSSGQYFVRLSTDEGTKTRKFIKL